MATPTIVKRLFRSNAAQWIAAYGIALYYHLIRKTGRIDRPPYPLSGPCILAIWHGRLLMIEMLRHEVKPIVALISSHRDGQIISKAASFCDVETAAGSSSQGGAKAARELIRYARTGHSLFVTPDGPRGPRMRVNEGVLDLARLTGLPILPISMSAGRGIILKSWDRFLLPGFFTKLVVRWGQPIVVGKDDDRNELLERLTAALIAIQNEADAAAGRAAVEPD